MKSDTTRRDRLSFIVALFLLEISASGLAMISGGTEYDMSWHTIDSGGGQAAGDGFELVGTIGQSDATQSSSGGPFTLAGGFWAAGSTAAPCPEDIDGAGGVPDGIVDVADLLEILASWGSCVGCTADLNGDGNVDVTDLLALLAAWGPC